LLSSQKYGSGIRDPEKKLNPDPGGVKKAPDPRSGSTTLGVKTSVLKKKGAGGLPVKPGRGVGVLGLLLAQCRLLAKSVWLGTGGSSDSLG